MAEPIITVEAPRRVDRKGGIRTVADFVDGVDRIATDGTTVHVSPGCTFPQTLLELCIPTSPEKTRKGIDQIEGLGGNFALYAGVECFLGGEDYAAAATTLLDQGEDRALESVLVTRILGGATAATTTSLGDAIAQADNNADNNYLGSPILIVNRGDVSRLVEDGALKAMTVRGATFEVDSTRVPFAVKTSPSSFAFSAPSSNADNNYLGSPILIVNRGDVSRLVGDGVLKAKDDGEVFTANGTRVLSTSKVAPGTVIATGQITVHRSSAETHQVAAHTTNREYAIAERAYAIVIDCGYTAVYTVTTGA